MTNGSRNGVHPFTPMISAARIRYAVRRIACEIVRDARCEQLDRLLLLGVLKGSVCFVADLVRHIPLPCELDFIHASSYRGARSTGSVRLAREGFSGVRGRDVIVVEDIVDTGRTVHALLKALGRGRPRSVRVCTLLDKQCKREVCVPIHYRGFVIPDAFVVGYGLDCDEQYRTLPFIARLNP